MPPTVETLLQPRKSPVQARSAASVVAILEATIQVLLHIGKDQLTTTRVAHRAGVSVGTLYQYFPNKSALLQAVLRRHLNAVTDAIETVCRQNHYQPLQQMAAALINGFLDVKLKDAETSVALYSVSSDVDGAKIALEVGVRSNRAIAQMLATSTEPLPDPQLAANMIQGAMVGTSRRMLESKATRPHIETTRRELIFLTSAYLKACAAASPLVP